METITRRLPRPPKSRGFTRTDAIEWEELPSLSSALRRAGEAGNPVWDATMPASLEPVFEPEPFRETITGLATREVREPDVFRHFFL